MNKPILARLEIPDRAILLYENMVLNDPDRRGNWRFFVRDDGSFFQTHNHELLVSDTALLASDDPALFWDAPFADTPDRCLTNEQQRELHAAIQQANILALDAYYPSKAFARTSSPTVERWTMIDATRPYTIIVEQHTGPEQLKRLGELIDQLVAAAPSASVR